jgi:hypothetical protein
MMQIISAERTSGDEATVLACRVCWCWQSVDSTPSSNADERERPQLQPPLS